MKHSVLLALVLALVAASPLAAAPRCHVFFLRCPRPSLTGPCRAAPIDSHRARRVAEMLDAGDTVAAGRYFARHLRGRNPDPELLGQYVRFLLLVSAPDEPGCVVFPPADRRAASMPAPFAAERALALATERNPALRPPLADLVLRTLFVRLHTALQAGEPAVAPDRVGHSQTGGEETSGFGRSMLTLGWTAIALSPATAARWAPRYEHLLRHAVRRGDVRTAMFLGNLCGDLAQGGNGAEDFRSANRALNSALDNYGGTDDCAAIRDVAAIYPVCFAEELAAVASGRDVDPNFRYLQVRLAEYGAEIALPAPQAGN